MWEIISSNLEVLEAMPVLNMQLLLDGMFIGAIFALAAYGLALVWGVMNVKNLAQGDFVIMGGYIAYWRRPRGLLLLHLEGHFYLGLFPVGYRRNCSILSHFNSC